MWKRIYRQFGMLLVLAALAAFFSAATIRRFEHSSQEAVSAMLGRLDSSPRDGLLVVVSGPTPASRAFAELCRKGLAERGFDSVERAEGQPFEVAAALDSLAQSGKQPAAILVSGEIAGQWTFLSPQGFHERFPRFSRTPLVVPGDYLWPVFLTRSNLEAVLNRIVVIAIVAIGMTLVIISAGIDLSVGSLVALAGVASTLTMVLGGKVSPAVAHAGVVGHAGLPGDRVFPG